MIVKDVREIVMFEVDINLLYIFLLQRYIIIWLSKDKKCSCTTINHNLPIPVKKDKTKLIIEGTCCSFDCLLRYLDEAKYRGDLKYIYSLNILWVVLSFMVSQTQFSA
jgi:hypothetical protein